MSFPWSFKKDRYCSRNGSSGYFCYFDCFKRNIWNLLWNFKTFNLEYLQTIVFILVIAALVQLVEMILKKYVKPLYQALGVYLPLITTNCAVLGVAISNIDNGYNFAESLACSFGTSFGFLISIVILAGIREKSEHNNIPKPFQGTPIVLVSAGLMAIAFTGFTGVI